MDPITMILSAASLAGGLLGGKRKMIDPNWLKMKFGPQAVSDEALQLFNNILNSPHGQKIMANAAEQGQSFAREINKRSAEAGLSGAGGASSGTGIFATSAAQGAGDSFARDERANLYQSVLPAAQQMVQNRMDTYMKDQWGGGSQTNSGRMWSQIGEAAGTVGSMYDASKKGPGKTDTNSSGQLAMPMFDAKSTLSEPRLPSSVVRKRRYSPSFGNIQRSTDFNSVLTR